MSRKIKLDLQEEDLDDDVAVSTTYDGHSTDASEKSNAMRFLAAFNNIDYAIKTRYNFNRSMGFSEAIRKAVAFNYIVRK